MSAVRYIERNPVRAKTARIPWRYEWSSAAAHTGERNPAPVLDVEAWRELARGINWKEMLTQADDPEIRAALRINTRTGRPLADDSFLSKVEHKLGRRLRAFPVGRPKKEETRV